MVTTWRVLVTWAHSRPPTDANSTRSLVTVEAETWNEAQLLAAQIVSCRPQCVMVTRTAALDD